MSPTVKTTWTAISATRGLPIPLAPVVHRTIERRNTSPFQQPARLDDAARFRAQRDAAAQLADLDRRKRAARPSAQKPRKAAAPKPKPKPKPRHAQVDIERAKHLYLEQRWATERIGREMGHSKSTIRAHLIAAGVPMRRGRSGFRKADPQTALDLVEKVGSRAQAARELGVSKATLERLIREARAAK